MNYEFNCHKAIEKLLKQKRVHIQDFIEFLNTFEILKKANFNDNANINTIWLEKNDIKKIFEILKTKTKSLKQKLYNIKHDFQRKQFLLKKLLRSQIEKRLLAIRKLIASTISYQFEQLLKIAFVISMISRSSSKVFETRLDLSRISKTRRKS